MTECVLRLEQLLTSEAAIFDHSVCSQWFALISACFEMCSSFRSISGAFIENQVLPWDCRRDPAVLSSWLRLEVSLSIAYDFKFVQNRRLRLAQMFGYADWWHSLVQVRGAIDFIIQTLSHWSSGAKVPKEKKIAVIKAIRFEGAAGESLVTNFDSRAIRTQLSVRWRDGMVSASRRVVHHVYTSLRWTSSYQWLFEYSVQLTNFVMSAVGLWWRGTSLMVLTSRAQIHGTCGIGEKPIET